MGKVRTLSLLLLEFLGGAETAWGFGRHDLDLGEF